MTCTIARAAAVAAPTGGTASNGGFNNTLAANHGTILVRVP